MVPVNLYIVNIREPAPDIDAAIEGLPAKRREKTKRYMRRDDRLRSLCSGLLLREICGLTDERDILFNAYGKPYAIGRAEFNLSHGGDYVILATCALPVGVDVEPVRAYDDAVARETTLPEEYAWIDGRADRFCALWTRKESVMKAAGLGLSLEPKRFSVCMENRERAQVFDVEYGVTTFPYDGHYISIAVPGEDVRCEIHSVSLESLLSPANGSGNHFSRPDPNTPPSGGE